MAPTRLINTLDLTFETKFASLRTGQLGFPAYAIISHRWESQEITYQEFLYFTGKDSARNDTVARILGIDLNKENGAGLKKVKDACQLARSRGFTWLWIDTVCIDKSSSAELSEAINSMYEWYKSSEQCLVYLSDVDDDTLDRRKLQELLAPKEVAFFNNSWTFLTLARDLGFEITDRTGIWNTCLGGELYVVPIAVRLSWLRNRTTSRIEDLSYCLLGICEVNMPLLYGEGDRAFSRLLKTIIASSTDESIFSLAPHLQDKNLQEKTRTQPGGQKDISWVEVPLLPRSPYEILSDVAHISVLRHAGLQSQSFTVTNAGVRMNVHYIPLDASLWAVAFRTMLVEGNVRRPLVRCFSVRSSDLVNGVTVLTPAFLNPQAVARAHLFWDKIQENSASTIKRAEVILAWYGLFRVMDSDEEKEA